MAAELLAAEDQQKKQEAKKRGKLQKKKSRSIFSQTFYLMLPNQLYLQCKDCNSGSQFIGCVICTEDFKHVSCYQSIWREGRLSAQWTNRG